MARWRPRPVLHLTPPPSRTRSANTVTPGCTGPAPEPRDAQAPAPPCSVHPPLRLPGEHRPRGV